MRFLGFARDDEVEGEIPRFASLTRNDDMMKEV